MKKIIILLLSCFCWCFPVFAAETPSDADEVTYLDILNTLLDDIDYDDLSEEEKIDLLSVYISSLSGPGVASSSDATLQSIDSSVSAILSAVSSDDTDIEADAVEIALSSEVALSSVGSDLGIDRDCIIYTGSFSGTSYYLVIPDEYKGDLWVSEDGYLYNLGTSNIVGRLYTDAYDFLSYDAPVFTLVPVLTNDASTIYNYGYPSYRRSYYESSSRLTYTDTYGLFSVSDVTYTASESDDYWQTICLYIIIFINGLGVIFCMNKLSRS